MIKTTLTILILATTLFGFAQKPKYTVAAFFADKFEGVITPQELANHKQLVLKPNMGKIISFDLMLSTGYFIQVLRNHGDTLPLRGQKMIKDDRLITVSFLKIKAEINGDTIELNPIHFELTKIAMNVSTDDFCVSYIPNFCNNCDITDSSLVNLRKIRGFYNDQTLPFHSLVVTYYKGGKRLKKTIVGQKDMQSLFSIIKQLKPTQGINLNQIKFKNGNELIYGTPLHYRKMPK